MKLGRKDLPRLAVLFTALLMVGAGLVLSHCRPRAASATRVAEGVTGDAQAATLDTPAEARAGEEATAAVQPADPSPQQPPEAGAGQTSSPQSPEPRQTSSPQRKRPARKPVPTRSLPPFQPSISEAGAGNGASGPPPGVLWLSGIIQGEPRVALIRRGENRYLVHEGDTVEGRYRVIQISSDRVSLQRGGRRLTLRLGDY